MRKVRKVFEGWLYKSYHPDDEHVVVSPKKLSLEELLEYIHKKYPGGGLFVKHWIKDTKRDWKELRLGYWFWLNDLGIKTIDELFEDLVGKKVRVTVEVVEGEV